MRCKYCYQSNDNLYGLLLRTIANNELKVMFPTWQLSNIHCPPIVQSKHIDTDRDTHRVKAAAQSFSLLNIAIESWELIIEMVLLFKSEFSYSKHFEAIFFSLMVEGISSSVIPFPSCLHLSSEGSVYMYVDVLSKLEPLLAYRSLETPFIPENNIKLALPPTSFLALKGYISLAMMLNQ